MSGPRHSKDANEASWDPWRTAKVLTLEDASYLFCGLRPVTDEEHRLAKTTYPANVRAMAQRLKAEVPHEGKRTGWRSRDFIFIFQRTDLDTWAKQNGFQWPWEASAAAPPSSASREALLKLVAVLALALAKKSGPGYQRGTEPNVSQIAELVEKTLAEELPDAETHGLGNTNIRQSIRAGWRLLTTAGKN